jgi:hypothetical protein
MMEISAILHGTDELKPAEIFRAARTTAQQAR